MIARPEFDGSFGIASEQLRSVYLHGCGGACVYKIGQINRHLVHWPHAGHMSPPGRSGSGTAGDNNWREQPFHPIM
jgi:hypothetical protein